MACIRVRRGKYVLDFRDAFGRRRWKTFPQTPEGMRYAEIEKGKALSQSGRRGECVYDPDITVQDYSETWLRIVTARLRASTVRNYSGGLRLHVLPLVGRFRLRDLSRPRLKLWVADVRTRLAGSSVSVMIGLLNSMLSSAVEDGLLESNPARGLGRIMGITSKREDDEIHAFTREQLGRFRAALAPPYVLPFLIYSYTGIRLAEGLGLQWEDVNLDEGYVLIRRQVLWNSGGLVKPPKSRRGHRRIVLSDVLREALANEQASRLAESLRTRRHSPWIMYPEWKHPPIETARRDAGRLSYAFGRALRAAGLPLHHSIHSLRHTYATLLLQRGEAIQFVSDQLGHSSIKITFDLYGRWLPMKSTMGGANLTDEQDVAKAFVR